MKPILFFFVLLLTSCGAVSPDLGEKFDRSDLKLSGTINSEMLEKLERRLTEGPHLQEIEVESAGGDQRIGITIGKLVVKNHLKVIVKTYCLSACAQYIFMTSPEPNLSYDSLVAFHNTATSDSIALAGSSDSHAKFITERIRKDEVELYHMAKLPVSLLELPIVGLSVICFKNGSAVDYGTESAKVFNRYPAYTITRDVLNRFGIHTSSENWPSNEGDLLRRLNKLPLSKSFGVYLISRGTPSQLHSAVSNRRVPLCTANELKE